jgi:hypothetical protein
LHLSSGNMVRSDWLHPFRKALVTDQRGTNITSEVQRDLPESVATAIVYNLEWAVARA